MHQEAAGVFVVRSRVHFRLGALFRQGLVVRHILWVVKPDRDQTGQLVRQGALPLEIILPSRRHSMNNGRHLGNGEGPERGEVLPRLDPDPPPACDQVAFFRGLGAFPES